MNKIYTIENAFLEITNNLISGIGKWKIFQINNQYSTIVKKEK